MINECLGFKLYSGKKSNSNVYVNEDLGIIIDASKNMPKLENKTICLTHNHDDHIYESNFIGNKVYIDEAGKEGLINPRVKNNIIYDDLKLSNGLWGSKTSSVIYGIINYFKSKFNKKIDFSKNLPEGLKKIHIGGHSPDSTMYLRKENGKKALFSGDLIYVDNDNVSIKTTDGVVSESIKGLEKVLEIEPDYLLPGHGEIIEGKENIMHLVTNLISYVKNEISEIVNIMNKNEGVSLKEIINERKYKTETFDGGQAFPIAVIKEEMNNNSEKYYIKNKRVYKNN